VNVSKNSIRRSAVLTVLVLAVSFLSGCTTHTQPDTRGAVGMFPQQGEYGGNLDVLRQFVVSPASSKESNFFIDMWDHGELSNYARLHGLTNNHALFVISHGGGIPTVLGPRYAYFQKLESGVKKSKALFSARDLAQVLGPERVASIHNLVIAGCNPDNTFSSTELRLSFPNATNVVHSFPGKNAHETLFRHALIYPSRDVQTLYMQPDDFRAGLFDESWQSKKAHPYIAELFLPGELMPYRIQTAGRELLDHTTHYALQSNSNNPDSPSISVIHKPIGRDSRLYQLR
jgi:hypothetical protein